MLFTLNDKLVLDGKINYIFIIININYSISFTSSLSNFRYIIINLDFFITFKTTKCRRILSISYLNSKFIN